MIIIDLNCRMFFNKNFLKRRFLLTYFLVACPPEIYRIITDRNIIQRDVGAKSLKPSLQPTPAEKL